MRSCGLDAIEDDIKAIFRRMDRNSDGRIKKKEYALTIMPLHIDKANIVEQLEHEDLRRELNTEEEEEEDQEEIRRELQEKRRIRKASKGR